MDEDAVACDVWTVPTKLAFPAKDSSEVSPLRPAHGRNLCGRGSFSCSARVLSAPAASCNTSPPALPSTPTKKMESSLVAPRGAREACWLSLSKLDSPASTPVPSPTSSGLTAGARARCDVRVNDLKGSGGAAL